MITLKQIVFILCLLLINLTVRACSCRSLGDFNQEEFNELGVIFTGEVVDTDIDTIINQGLVQSVVKFKTKEIFRGHSDNGFVYVSSPYGNCSISFKKGEQYLLFLYQGYDIARVSVCSRKVKIKDIEKYIAPDWLKKYTNKPDGLDKSYYPNEKIASVGKLVNQEPDGLWKYYHKYGNLKSIGYYKNGTKDSLWSYYDIDDNKSVDRSFKENKRHGKVIYYFDGKITSVEQYANGLKHGYCYHLYDDGTKRRESKYKNDRLLEYSSYYENGAKEEYQNDTLEIRWYENGNKEYERYSKNGKKVNWQSWWENGNISSIILSNEKGQEIMVYSSRENGEIMVNNGTGYCDGGGMKGKYKDGLKVGLWRQTFHGGSVKETHYKKGIKDGVSKRWNESGQLTFKGAYKDGNCFGLWKFWYDSGEIQMEREWVDGENLLINSWNPDGVQLVKDGNGIHTYYYDDGRISMSPTEFENGRIKNLSKID